MTGGCHWLFTVCGLLYYPITDILKMAFSSPAAKQFHLFPFKQFWQNTEDGTEQQVYDELYTSDAWLEAHNNLQKQANKPGCKLNKIIVAMMFSSDATMLASFRTAKAWLVYLYFGNVSKYTRAQPTSGTCHHVAFISSVSEFLSWVSCNIN